VGEVPVRSRGVGRAHRRGKRVTPEKVVEPAAPHELPVGALVLDVQQRLLARCHQQEREQKRVPGRLGPEEGDGAERQPPD